MVGRVGAGAMQYVKDHNADAVTHGKRLREAVVTDNNIRRCGPGTKPGNSGPSNASGQVFASMVKAPVHSEARLAPPLRMVSAPAGRPRFKSEDYRYLPREGTAAGFATIVRRLDIAAS
jgi:hypothetical protein